jgi:hypothetical protein
MKKIIRSILLALLASLVFGLAVGTVIRLRLERPVVYFVGQNEPGTGRTSPAAARTPGNVGDVRPAVLDARHHEEQIG